MENVMPFFITELYHNASPCSFGSRGKNKNDLILHPHYIQGVRQVSRLLIIFGTWYHFQEGSLLKSFFPWSPAGKSTVHYTWCQWLPVVIIVSTQVFVGSRMGWLSAKGWLRPTTSDCLTLFSWGCPICLSSSCVCIKLVFMFLWCLLPTRTKQESGIDAKTRNSSLYSQLDKLLLFIWPLHCLYPDNKVL